MVTVGTVVTTGLSHSGSALQAVDPTIVAETSGLTRAVLSFFLTVFFGGAVIYRYGDRLDDAVDASIDNPLLSVVYGIIAYGGVVFLFGYAYSQLARVGVETGAIAVVAIPAFGGLVLLLGGAGFAVVGAWLASIADFRDPQTGLVAVSIAGGLGWLLLPDAFAVLTWLGIAAVGIGGPVRRWFHAESTRVEHD